MVEESKRSRMFKKTTFPLALVAIDRICAVYKDPLFSRFHRIQSITNKSAYKSLDRSMSGAEKKDDPMDPCHRVMLPLALLFSWFHPSFSRALAVIPIPSGSSPL